MFRTLSWGWIRKGIFATDTRVTGMVLNGFVYSMRPPNLVLFRSATAVLHISLLFE